MKINKDCVCSSNEEISELRVKCEKLRAKIRNSVVKISEFVSDDTISDDDESSVQAHSSSKEGI
jgi:hypothetical protein